MHTKKPTLKKQIVGALVGGALAVGAYYAYTFAEPLVTGYILQPENYPKFLSGEDTVLSNTQLEGERKDRLEAKVQKSITFNNSSLHSGPPEEFIPEYKPYQVPVQGNINYGPERVISEEITTTTVETITETIKHVETLPDSGPQTYLAVFGALVGALGVRRLKNQ